MRINILTLVAVILVLIVVGWQQRGLPWDAWRVIGVAITLPAIVLLAIARLQLGRAFSVQAKATKLVTTGLYRRLRNPIYVFGAVLLGGLVIYAHQPWFLLIFLVLIPLQVRRAREEARVLHEAFGEEYERYIAQTWF